MRRKKKNLPEPLSAEAAERAEKLVMGALMADKSSEWLKLGFEQRALRLRRGEEPRELWEATRLRLPSMSESEMAAAFRALIVPRDLWIQAAKEISDLVTPAIQKIAADLLAVVKPLQVLSAQKAEELMRAMGEPSKQTREMLEEFLRNVKALKAEGERTRPQPIADSDGNFKMASNQINHATTLALTPGAMKRAGDITSELDRLSAQGLARVTDMRSAYTFQYKNGTTGAIGFFNDPGDALWALIQQNGELAIRLQCALWAHAYAETGGEPMPGKYITLDISDLCDSLGYKRHHKGAHHLKNKQNVKNGLRANTQIELAAISKLPNGKAVRLTGPVWSRGLETDTAENPATDSWDPQKFTYAPGAFFSDPNWREYNKSFALVGQNLLKLQGTHDKWAVMIGGYLATLSQLNDYQPRVLKVKTLLEKSGMLSTFRKRRRPGDMQDALIRALDRLVKVGVLASWRFDKTGLSTDEVDLLDELALDRMHKENAKDWRSWNVVIEWPARLKEIGTEHQQKLEAKKATKSRDKRSTKARRKR